MDRGEVIVTKTGSGILGIILEYYERINKMGEFITKQLLQSHKNMALESFQATDRRGCHPTQLFVSEYLVTFYTMASKY